MKRLLKTLAISAPLFMSQLAFADTESSGIDERDIQAMREWLNAKRQVTVKELGGALSISGQVRGEFKTSRESVDGHRQGSKFAEALKAGKLSPKNEFDVEFNFLMDYRTEKTWSAVKIEYDNNAGIFGGNSDKLNLERAVFGARLFKNEGTTVDGEIGRRGLSEIFDSVLMYAATFDGILLKYDLGYETVGDAFIHGGAFIIDERKDHYGYVGEVGLLNIMGTGFYSKISVIDWDTKEYKNSNPTTVIEKLKAFEEEHKFKYLISQYLLGYRFSPKFLNKVVLLYGAGLVNHRAERNIFTHNEKANWGSYVGISVGQLRNQWDYAFDINYQWLAAQAVPDFDNSGIGIGSYGKSGLFTDRSGDNLRNPGTGTNKGNYRGVSVRFDVLVTNNIAVTQNFLISRTLNENIGPHRRFKQYEMELIYSF